MRKSLPGYTATRGEFSVLALPSLRYVMLDGHGEHNQAADCEQDLTTIYPFTYTLKFLSKGALDHDYVVPPLEALWWTDDMTAFTSALHGADWDWTVLNLVPDWITDEHVEQARATVARKGGAPALDNGSHGEATRDQSQ